MTRIIIIGAGGHAQVTADIIRCMQINGSDLYPIGYLDDDQQMTGQTLLDLPILGTTDSINQFAYDAVIVAIGNNQVRLKIATELASQGVKFARAIHPTAVIGSQVFIGQGSMICANTVINTGSTIGDHVILNTATTVDHHNKIGNGVHIAPGTHTGGGVTIENGAFIGIGATIMPRKIVHTWATVGAGAVVNKDIQAHSVVVGIPASLLRK